MKYEKVMIEKRAIFGGINAKDQCLSTIHFFKKMIKVFTND